MEMGISINTILQLLLTVAVGYIGWSSKELYNKGEKRQETAEKNIKSLEQTINENSKEMLKCFVTKDDHYRDLNALENKIDNIKDILLDVKEDIGKLTGAQEKGANKIG